MSKAAELAHLFRALKAPAAARALPRLAGRAREEEWGYECFAEALLSTEVASRESHGGVSGGIAWPNVDEQRLIVVIENYCPVASRASPVELWDLGRRRAHRSLSRKRKFATYRSEAGGRPRGQRT